MTWFFIILAACVVMIGAGLVARSYLTGQPLTGNLFPARPEKRITISEQTAIDNRRRLILIKRDNVEHLIMTGGPVDVVIESGIGAPRARPALADTESPTPVFTRQPRSIGQAAGE
jgi:flagellar protein FliO/FliZ